jgi:sugar O-acyltransferase (sialic acid O-acetyltransferase NeuD family)
MMTANIVILGGRGDGTVVLQAAHDSMAAGADVVVLGFLNDDFQSGAHLHGLPVLGTLFDWRRVDEGVSFISALHKVKQMEARAGKIASLGIPDSRFATVVHPTACIAGDVQIGAGTFLAAHSVVQPGARIGRHVSIRGGANIGHDAVIEDFAYVGPNATLSGRAVLETGAHLGPNAAVLDQRRVGRYAVVGLCSAVTRNIPDREIWMGVPARRVLSIPPLHP